MTSKERVKVALSHKEPDRVPIFSSFTPEFAQHLHQHLGLPNFDSQNPFGGESHDLEEALGLDFIQYYVGIANSFYYSNLDEYICEWGIKWKQVEYETKFGIGHYTEIIDHPLANDNVIYQYKPPDSSRKELYLPLKNVIEKYGNKYFILGVTVCTIFEAAWYLRGMNNLLVDMITDEEKTNYILDIPFNYHLEAAKKLVEMGVDGIWIGDDVGTQKGMLISPNLWRKYLKPRMAQFCQELKIINPFLKIAYHSDGNVYPIIEELIEIGIDVLNPIQPKAMDPSFLKKQYGSRLSMWGTIDEQYTLPFGTEEEVRDETLEYIRKIGPGGGFIISPTHHVQLDTPTENFLTFLDTVKKNGYYPIH
jgi:uroporphyrinogen decarboxylase